jgi:hypothetical protein
MQILQTQGELVMLFEYDSLRREIYTVGRPHDTSIVPLWMGDSIGHWEGDTLVGDTVNFNIGLTAGLVTTPFTMLFLAPC